MNANMTDESPISEDDLDDAWGVYRPERGRPAPEWMHPDTYPRLTNISAGMLFGDRMVKAVEPSRPEYVTIPMRARWSTELQVMVCEWNLLWEMAQFRRRRYDLDELPAPMAKVADLGDHNVIFVPRTRSRYHEYAPLYHLLPLSTLQRFGMPVIRSGNWPFMIDVREAALPANFADQMSKAWASHIWRHLMPGSSQSGFTDDDPIRLLAHNLDFWLPPVTELVQQLLQLNPEVAGEPVEPEPVRLEDDSILEGAPNSDAPASAVKSGMANSKPTR